MKYFIDTEFHEYQKKPLFGKPIDTIELISVGIVSEDNYIKGKDYSHPSEYKGREYYAISKDFNLKEAWNRYDLKTRNDAGGNTFQYKVYWLRDNVLKPIWEELRNKPNSKRIDFNGNSKDNYFSYNSLKYLIKRYGKTNKQIAEEVYEFCSNNYHKGNNLTYEQRKAYSLYDMFKPEFYGYYADYDWVVFCWLFDKMIDLPKGFPMYCIDLKQTLDEKIKKSWKDVEMSTWGHNGIENITKLPDYPKQTNEHNALANAKWTKEFYKFLNKL